MAVNTKTYNTAQAAKELGVSRRTITNMVKDGRLVPVKSGGGKFEFSAEAINTLRRRIASAEEIQDYTIAQALNLAALIERVRELQADGWVVSGGVAMVVVGSDLVYAQALVRANIN